MRQCEDQLEVSSQNAGPRNRDFRESLIADNVARHTGDEQARNQAGRGDCSSIDQRINGVGRHVHDREYGVEGAAGWPGKKSGG